MKKINILLGVSSSIAAVKIPEIIKILKSEGFDLNIVITKNTKRLFGKKFFYENLGKRVISSFDFEKYDYRKILQKREIFHIDIAGKADLVMVCPATANIIAKIAHGFADDFLTTTILSSSADIVVCPAMNTNMWRKTAVQKNIQILKKRGVFIIEPVSGNLACGTKGVGRLAEPRQIVDYIKNHLKRCKSLKGKKILVTAGGTREKIDSVRDITNKSSGKMGVFLAEQAYKRGAKVCLLRSKNSVKTQLPVQEFVFDTGKQLEILLKENIFGIDAVFHVAAVSDFVRDGVSEQKLKSNKPLIMKFKPTTKILNKIKSWNNRSVLIGFKAVWSLSDKKCIEAGRIKLKESKSDYIVVNDVGRKDVGFEVDTNEVFIVSTKGYMKKIKKTHKRVIADRLLDIIKF